MKKMILISLILSGYIFAKGFTVTSSDFSGQLSSNQVFNGFGCTGKNISPQLKWENAPTGTKSFAVTMYDPDAPTGSGWWHWVVFDIPSNTKSITANASANGNLPKGSIESMTDFGKTGFGGACPPQGDKAHQYIITLHALNTKSLKLDKKSSPALVGFMLNAHTIEKTSIVSYYKR